MEVANRQFYESRGKDIPTEVLMGIADAGFCGSDVFKEGSLAGMYKPLGFRALMGAGCDLVIAGRPGLDFSKSLRVATSFPLQTIAGFSKLGYNLDLDKLDEWGGKIEAKMATGKYDAVVDLRSSGDTLRDNGLIVYDCLDTIQTGLVYRKESYDPRDFVVSPWRIYAEAQTLIARKRDLQAGTNPVPGKKSTLLLLSDANKRRKNLGEECAELVAADALGENVIEEAADIGYATKVIGLANNLSPIRLLNEELMRNKKPEL